MNPQSMERRFDLRLREVLYGATNAEHMPGLESRLLAAVVARWEDLQPGRPGSVTPARRRDIMLWGGGAAQTGGSTRGVWAAVLAHAGMLGLLFVVFARGGRMVKPAGEAPSAIALLAPPPPLLQEPVALSPALNSSRGGGGRPGPAPASKGAPPRFALELKPPVGPSVDAPKLQIPVAVEPPSLQSPGTPMLGVNGASPLAALSLGNGRGLGFGSGRGPGVGPGSGGNQGGGPRRIGGSVSAPVILFQPEAEFSDEARRSKVSGNVLVYLQVDEQGLPQDVRVLRGIGAGLDEKALEAVRHYRFRPATEDGRPVRVEMQVEVDFGIY